MYKDDNGEWFLSTNGAYNGKSLAWMVKNRSHWVIETLVPSVFDGEVHTAAEKHAAIDAEVERQRTWGA